MTVFLASVDGRRSLIQTDNKKAADDYALRDTDLPSVAATIVFTCKAVSADELLELLAEGLIVEVPPAT